MSKSIDHSITNGGLVLLYNVLKQPGWYEGKDATKHLFTAGTLITRFEEQYAPLLNEPLPPEHAVAAINLPVEDTHRATVRLCLEHFAKKGAFAPSAHVLKLLAEFGLGA